MGNGDTVAFHHIGHQMSNFKAKMHQIRRWGAYSSPQTPSWI